MHVCMYINSCVALGITRLICRNLQSKSGNKGELVELIRLAGNAGNSSSYIPHRLLGESIQVVSRLYAIGIRQTCLSPVCRV